jgi:hypothetical protein
MLPRFLKIKPVLALLFACAALLGGDGYAQDKAASGPRTVTGVDCNDEEFVKALLDDAAITSMSAGGKSIIIIARLGSGERSRQLSQRRLSIPSKYLAENRGVAKSRIITAEGARVSGPGQVEVYVGGNLHVLFKMKRQRDFGGGCWPPQ